MPARAHDAPKAVSAAAAGPADAKQKAVVAVFKNTEPCRYYPRCREGDACKFAHSPDEIRRRPSLTKTRMCAGYYDGRCRLPSSECGFAHGEDDLRPRSAKVEGPDVPQAQKGSNGQATVAPFALGLGCGRAPSTDVASSTSSGGSSAADSDFGFATDSDFGSAPRRPAAAPRAAGPAAQDSCASQRPLAETAGPSLHQGWSMPMQVAHEVSEPFRMWVEDVRTCRGASRWHTPAFFATIGDCLAALAASAPQRYDD